MRLQGMRSAVRADLGILVTDLTDTEVERAISRAVLDLSRVIPNDKVADVTLVATITGEAGVFATTPGTWTQLGNKYIRDERITVLGVLLTRDVDYRIDLANGRVTHLAAPNNLAAFLVNYSLDGTHVDLAPVVTNLFQVDAVLYQGGDVPANSVDFQLRGYVLEIRAGRESQARVTDLRHIWVYYSSAHDPPSTVANGSYPEALDEVVAKGAGLYCLQMVATRQEILALGDLANGRTALGSLAALHVSISSARGSVASAQALAKAALDKVTGQVVKADLALDKVDVQVSLARGLLAGVALAGVDTDLTAAISSLGLAAGALDKVDTWQQGSNSVADALVTALTRLGDITNDVADAKAALDLASSPLGQVAGMLTGSSDSIKSDLANLQSVSGAAAASVATAQVAAAAAIGQLGPAATRLISADGDLTTAVAQGTTMAGEITASELSAGVTDALAGAHTQGLDGITTLADADIAKIGVQTGLSTADQRGTDARLAAITAESRFDSTYPGDAAVMANAGDVHITTGAGLLDGVTGDLGHVNNADTDVGNQLQLALDYLGNEGNTALAKVGSDLAGRVFPVLALAEGVWAGGENNQINISANYLDVGDGTINAVTPGKDVPDRYAQYADSSLKIAAMWQEKRKDFLAEAAEYLKAVEAWLKEGDARTAQALAAVQGATVSSTIGRVWVESSVARVQAATAAAGLTRAKVEQAQSLVAAANAVVGQGEGFVHESEALARVQANYVQAAATQVQLIGQYVAEAGVKVEVARVFVQEGLANVEVMKSLVSAAQTRGQLVDALTKMATTRIEAARVTVADAEARAASARVLAEASGNHAQLVTALANGVGARAQGVGSMVNAGQGMVQYGLGLLDRARTRLGQAEGYLKVAAARSQTADTDVQEGRARVEVALARVQAANARLEGLKTLVTGAGQYLEAATRYSQEAQFRLVGAETYAREGEQRSGQVGNYLREIELLVQEAQSYQEEATRWQQGSAASQNLAKVILEQVSSRLGEYNAILNASASWRQGRVIASTLQPTAT